MGPFACFASRSHGLLNLQSPATLGVVTSPSSKSAPRAWKARYCHEFVGCAVVVMASLPGDGLHRQRGFCGISHCNPPKTEVLGFIEQHLGRSDMASTLRDTLLVNSTCFSLNHIMLKTPLSGLSSASGTAM